MMFSIGTRMIGPFTFDFLYDDDHGEKCRSIKVSDGDGWEVTSPIFGAGDEAFRNHACWALLMARTRAKEYHQLLFEKYKEMVTQNGGSEQGASLSFNYEPGERSAYTA